MRIGIITSKATSLRNVARDIASVSMMYKHVPRLLDFVEEPTSIGELCDGCILIYPASPLYCAPQFLFYRDFKLYVGKPIIFYTTIEGRPSRKHIKLWMTRDVEFIANSKYVFDKLVEAGFNVIDVIPHGILLNQIRKAEKMIPIVRKHLEKLHGDKVVFGAVAFYHPRKGLDLLAEATALLSKKRKDFVVHLITSPQAKKYLPVLDNLYIDTVFGMRSREDILAFLGACDYVIIPSLAEGFGLPLLEANAMGTPCIFPAYEPLIEIGDMENNLIFDYKYIKLMDIGEGIEFEFHIYDPKDLADQMNYAIYLKRKLEREYKKRCEKVRDVIRKFSAEKVYSKLLKYLSG
ncbi:MAG: hypothetical protein DRP11_01440 [Candidatus Aenigmatarchaeota archaeon]|nr:MAG: hypothetical protein DRP11_01440 [Candidatus Aenigmarchaeota archaeon]